MILEHGRFLDEFVALHNERIAHPWEVTVDQGMVALFQASFLDATPTYASAAYARELGFRDRPVPPVLLLNLGLSMSVHDVSERAVAHLAYIDVRFPDVCYAGDTLVASSTVLGVTASREGRGVVHVATRLGTLDGRTVCAFERKVMVRARTNTEARSSSVTSPVHELLPPPLRGTLTRPTRDHGFAPFDFAPGDVLVHAAGRTVTESEHVTLAWLTRNTHPLHYDELYCQGGGSFAKTRVVYGGLVFAWVVALASRDVAGQAIWDVGFDRGAHSAPVVAGDTLYAASRVESVEPLQGARLVKMRLVGVKNRRASEGELFTFERDKSDGERMRDKVFEVERTVLVW
jgi:2-methylfumaryl-CoA hydratase